MPDSAFHATEAEMRMPEPPVVSVVLGDPRQGTRPLMRNAKVQTQADGQVRRSMPARFCSTLWSELGGSADRSWSKSCRR